MRRIVDQSLVQRHPEAAVQFPRWGRDHLSRVSGDSAAQDGKQHQNAGHVGTHSGGSHMAL
jgi:hypothetical protein